MRVLFHTHSKLLLLYTIIQHSSSQNVVEFSYDPQSDLGPNKWEFVNVSQSEYWTYFINDTSYNHSYSNDCNDPIGKESPLNLDPNVACKDDHHIKTSRGQDDFKTLDFSILPYALRVNFNNRRGAKANFSNLSNGVNATHLEIKIPSEHYLFGQQFQGELVISHHFPSVGGIINVGVMLDDSKDVHNVYLEQFIREWEEALWKDQSMCDGTTYTRTYEYLSQDEMKEIWGAPKKNSEADYDLYKLLPTLWYCGYQGGLTIPPCTKSVIWRILDLPLMISKDQVQRMKNLLLNRVDENCNTNATYAYNGTVNRPLQEIKLPNVWCCTSNNWRFSKLKGHKHDWYQRRSSWPTYYHGFK